MLKSSKQRTIFCIVFMPVMLLGQLAALFWMREHMHPLIIRDLLADMQNNPHFDLEGINTMSYLSVFSLLRDHMLAHILILSLATVFLIVQLIRKRRWYTILAASYHALLLPAVTVPWAIAFYGHSYSKSLYVTLSFFTVNDFQPFGIILYILLAVVDICFAVGYWRDGRTTL